MARAFFPGFVGTTTQVLAKTSLRPDGGSAAAARRFVADVLVNRGFPDAVVEHAMLVTSEVVTDAALHGGTDIEVAVVADPLMARVEVQNGRSEAPFLHDDSETEGETVWRRQIIQSFADGWGIERNTAGRRVWFEIRP